jgi:hypothetical protein
MDRKGQAWAALAVAALASLVPAPAIAGPPYETDDPEPTDPGKYEVYLFASLDGPFREASGDAGLDLNFGPVKDVQLTATLPLGYARDPERHRWSAGAGDVELGIKYRVVHIESAGISAAIFPRVILPTARRALGKGRTRLLLPLWGQKDIGSWSLFGGGGYEINPGPRNRSFWSEGVALTRQVSHAVTIGGEVTHQGADAIDATPSTSLGLGSIVKLGGPYALLLSVGPTFSRGRNSFHTYAALGLNF